MIWKALEAAGWLFPAFYVAVIVDASRKNLWPGPDGLAPALVGAAILALGTSAVAFCAFMALLTMTGP